MTGEDSSGEAGRDLRHLGDAMSRVVTILLDRHVGLPEALAAFELCYARAAVARQGGNLSQAAVDLGIHRNTLRAKLQRNGSPSPPVTRDRNPALS